MSRRLEFRHRISLLVLLAAVALVIVTAVTLVSGRENTRQLTGIETRYVPLIEVNGTLTRLYQTITRTLEDAAGAGEESKIADADRLRDELRAHLAGASTVIADNGGDAAALDQKFVAYYTVAREVSRALAAGAQFQQLADQIEAMRVTQRAFAAELDTATSPNRVKLAAAFAAARESQATLLRIDIIVATVALLVMGLLSWQIIRRTIRSLHAVSEGVERLAHGNFGQAIAVEGDDELGDLAREANRTADRLREYREQSERETWIETGLAELAASTAGELSVTALANNAMKHIASYVGATASAVFVGDEHGAFKRAASTSTGMPSAPSTFQRDDQTPLASLVREATIASHQGERRVHTSEVHEVAVPLAHEGRVLGLLVLGMTEPATEKALALLERVAPLVGIALRVAESRERLQTSLLETQRQALAAETANKELESFSYSVSHDIPAPQRGIDGFSQALVEEEGDKLSPESQGYLRRIRAAAQRMAELIDDLLQLSRVSRSDFRRDDVNLSALAETVVTELRRANPERSVEVAIQPDVKAHADARLVRIALENLLGNAWKFTSKAEAARIEFGAREQDAQLVYFVRDNGAGFDMKYVDRLFGAFQRLHSDKEYAGTGIGLATVQRIVLRHGGRIWVEAAVDRGATFQFTLPKPVAGAIARA